MRLDHIAPIQERHLTVRLDPHLVARVRRNHVQRRDVQPELARARELAQARAQREQVGARDRGGEVCERQPYVVDARGVQAEDVAVGGGAGAGAGGRGGRGGDQVVERAAGVVGEFGEEGLCFLLGEGAHCGWKGGEGAVGIVVG